MEKRIQHLDSPATVIISTSLAWIHHPTNVTSSWQALRTRTHSRRRRQLHVSF